MIIIQGVVLIVSIKIYIGILFVLSTLLWPVWIIGTLFVAGVLFFFLPIKGKFKLRYEKPGFRYDERDTIFSRLELTHRPELQESYYRENPDKREKDKIWQERPGLMSEESTYYSPFTFAAADASFDTIEKLRPFADGEINSKQKNINPKKTTDFISKWGKRMGAVSIGFCRMEDYHFYSVRGRGEAYGKAVDSEHGYGIALTVEMDEEFLATGPAGPTLMESARQYLNSGTIAIQIAHFLRGLGYSARAHIDGNYEVICPLVARDAGLGELGRMGLLITPKLGPRVRIAVITTDFPVEISPRKPDYSVHDFCNRCMKCANVCPAQAIPKEEIALINGVERWQINHEKCFGYWCTTGTDCGRCMSVCPYAHKNNWFHNFIRWGIRNNIYFRRIAVVLDDVFYGKKPESRQVPDWVKVYNDS